MNSTSDLSTEHKEERRILIQCAFLFVIGSVMNWVLSTAGVSLFHVDDLRDGVLLMACFYAVRVARQLKSLVTKETGRWRLIAIRTNDICLVGVGLGVLLAPLLLATGIAAVAAVGLVAFGLIVITFNTYFYTRFGSRRSQDEDSSLRASGLGRLLVILGLSLVALAVVYLQAFTTNLGVILLVLLLLPSGIRWPIDLSGHETA